MPDNIRGGLFMVALMVCFAVSDAIIKSLGVFACIPGCGYAGWGSSIAAGFISNALRLEGA